MAATLWGRLAELADARPDAVALAAADGELTYARWHARALALAGGLRGAGVRAGERAAVCVDAARWGEYAVACLGVQAAGAVPVPVGAGLADLERRRVLSDVAAVVLVAPDDLALGEPAVARCDPGRLEAEGGGEPAVAPADADLAAVYAASGPLSPTMSEPRAAGDVLAGPCACLGRDAGARTLAHAFPPGTRWGHEALAAALGPAPVTVVARPGFDPEDLCAAVAAAPAPACAVDAVAAPALFAAAAGHDVGGVIAVLVAGAAADEELTARAAAAFPGACVRQAAPPEGVRVHRRPRGAADVPEAQAGSVRVHRRPRGAADVPELQQEGAQGAQGALGAQEGEVAVAPVAASQQGMLWHERFAPGCQNLPGLARRFRGPLDVAALHAALDAIVARHEALRTTFAVRDGQAVQLVWPHEGLDLPVADLRGLPADERDAEVARRVAAAGRAPIDLVAGPLFAAQLLRLAEDDHVLVLRTHHSVFDDWSVGVFRRELAAGYHAFARGHAAPWAQPPASFTEFARRQHERLAGRAGERQLAFWRRELDGAPLATQLPVDDPDRPAGSPQPAAEPVTVTVPAPVAGAVRALARDERVTVFMALLTAFAALTARYTGRDDLVVATVVAHRNRTELEGVIGCFTKKVPLRVDLAGDPTFREALARTRAALLGALGHQDLAFDDVLQDVLGARAAAHGLVPHVALMFQGVTPEQGLELDDVDSEGLATSATAARAHFAAGDDAADAAAAHDPGDAPPAEAPPWGDGLYLGTFVICSVTDTGADLSCLARGAFHPPAMRDVLARLVTLLGDAVADPDRALSRLALLDDDAATAASALGCGPVAAVGAAGTAAQRWAARCERDGKRLAVVTADAAFTFADVDAAAARYAERADAARVEGVVAAVAAWTAGAAMGDAAAPDVGRLATRLAHAEDERDDERRTALLPAPTEPAFTRCMARLLNGHPVWVPDRWPLEPGEVVALVADGRVDRLDVPAEDAERLLDVGLARALRQRGATAPAVALTVATPGGLDGEPRRRLASLDGARVTVLAGPPQWGVAAIGRRLDAGPRRGDAGWPLPGVAAHVLDADGRVAPDRAVGELYVGDATGDDGEGQPTGRLARRLPDGRVELLAAGGEHADLGGFVADPARVRRALRGWPGLSDAAVAVEADEAGEPRVTVRVPAGSSAPSLAALRARVWARIPGSVFPSAVALDPPDPPHPPAPPGPADPPAVQALARAWAPARGTGRGGVAAIYWQDFAFLDALDRVRDAGVAVADARVARNRTLETLAADLAATAQADGHGRGRS